MKIFKTVTVILLLATIAIHPAWGKDIVQDSGSATGENRAYIRADGLACYFCAYGLERFFRESGKVATYDMKMKEGIVEIGFIKEKALLTKKELDQIVYDAGYTPRSTTYELIGTLSKNIAGRFIFYITENGQKIPVKINQVISSRAKEITGKKIRLKAKAAQPKNSPMSLNPLEITILGTK